MAKRIRCHCKGDPACKLCRGTKFYEYEPGPRGWMPFPCPTCEATGKVPGEGGSTATCATCRGYKSVDPADPPVGGPLDVFWKIIMGA